MSDIYITWPKHKISLSVEHNRHLNYYETIEQAIENNTYDVEWWPDEAELELSKKTGEVWEIQWYPDTPIGFFIVIAATFERALKEANNVSY